MTGGPREVSSGMRAALVAVAARLGLGKLARVVLGKVRAERIRDRARWGTGASQPESATPPTIQAPVPSLPFGANVIGNLRVESGVGEASRAIARSLTAAGVPVSAVDVPAQEYRSNDTSLSDLPQGAPYRFNICYVNADQSSQVRRRLGETVFRDHYTIGCWAWELEEFPSRWTDSFGLVDEIWTPSGFAADAVSRASPVPVLSMPHSIRVDNIGTLPDEAAAIPRDHFVFLFVYDYRSLAERKNPLAAVRAFTNAFSQDEAVHLVLKATNSNVSPEYHQRLLEAAGSARVTVIDRYLDRSSVNALLRRCNCYVSLHRSEGFGLTMAEAMYLGKPVIATGYSGNMDYMPPGASFLVRFTMTEIGTDCGPYRGGWHWAEPDVEHAADLMRQVVNQSDEASVVAARGAQVIRERFSAEAVGKRARRRLELVWRRLSGTG